MTHILLEDLALKSVGSSFSCADLITLALGNKSLILSSNSYVSRLMLEMTWSAKNQYSRKDKQPYAYIGNNKSNVKSAIGNHHKFSLDSTNSIISAGHDMRHAL